jgi:hypothetical protein
MAVYVDNELIPWRGQVWCHLVADTPDELHRFARKLGLKPSWFQVDSVYPHYDVTASIREKALQLGAVDSDRATIIACAKRLKKRIEIESRQEQTSFAF